MLKFLVVAALFIFSFSAFASADEMILGAACKANPVCGDGLDEYLQKIQLKCEIETQTQKCSELAATNPEWASLMRKCDVKGLCEQNKEFVKDKQLACLRGYKNALVDLGIALKDMTVSLGGLVESSWDNLKNNAAKRNEFLKECNKTLSCKRELIKNDHRYNELPDEKIEKLSASFLFAEAEEMKSYQASLDRSRPKPYVPISERTKDDTELSVEQQQKLQGLMAMAKEQVQKQYSRYVCYSPAAREELECYVLGNIIDPTMVAGYFMKGARVASAGRRVADGAAMGERRISDVSRVVSEELKVTAAKVPKTIPQVPEGLKLENVQRFDGSEYIQYSYAEKLPDGTWVRNQKELPFDKLTGGIDANYPAGREFFEKIVEAKAGKAHLAFIDVGGLGAVNKRFQAGEVAGDRYLKAVAAEIMKNGEGKVTLARMGGDEFALVIDSADPKKVQSILEKIQEGIRKNLDGDAHQVFREEKIVRAEKYREEAKKLSAQRSDGMLTAEDKKVLRQDIDDLAKIQQPDISIGSSQIGQRESFNNTLARAESQAKDMKIDTALNFGRSAEKYGSDATPRSRPSPLYTAKVEPPASSQTWAEKGSAGEKVDLESLRTMKLERKQEVSRIGDSTLARYEDEMGRSRYKVEKYSTDPKTGKRVQTSYEVTTRGTTGMLDGLHPESQKLVMQQLKASSDAVLVMPKLTSLRYLNYFEQGTKAGDEMLEAVSKAIHSGVRSEDLTFKLNGADFLWSTNKMKPSEVQAVTRRVNENLLKSPKVKAIMDNERSLLTSKLETARRQGDKVAQQRLTQKLEELKNFKPDLQFQTVTSQEAKSATSLPDVLKILDQKFPQ
ncbi:response regulator PleD [compost metagenome]